VRRLKILGVLSLLVSFLEAHTLMMNIANNGDGTITVVGEFSTGELAAGAMVRLESLVSGSTLFKQRLGVEGELAIPIPKEPYQVVLDGGPGHVIVKEGIAPAEGFSIQVSEAGKSTKKLSEAQSSTGEWSLPTMILFSLAMALMGLTLYFSARNTKKLLELSSTSPITPSAKKE